MNFLKTFVIFTGIFIWLLVCGFVYIYQVDYLNTNQFISIMIFKWGLYFLFITLQFLLVLEFMESYYKRKKLPLEKNSQLNWSILNIALPFLGGFFIRAFIESNFSLNAILDNGMLGLPIFPGFWSLLFLLSYYILLLPLLRRSFK